MIKLCYSCTIFKVVDVHPSIGELERLKVLNSRGCKSLGTLPIKIRMESVETFILSGCLKLLKFPEINSKMEGLLEHYLAETGIQELPSSIRNLEKLVLLNLKDCSTLASLPGSIGTNSKKNS
ncbi:hypothetical protein GOBAR_AA31025 [Gossypium barbadense]|uniref:Disease resistance protein RPS4B/Roq1-like leucine-rich repeats domain-containing protein n=1 Tax=Gossypium barbadense TaxID=3634 RepID=A0A2P5WEX4_GOSBA|nr:hypothetical protein GOBAR_AA31025 [Gossypium barbadense]